MVFLDNIFKRSSNEENGKKNIGKMTTEKANDLLKSLSGGDIEYRKKLIENVVVVAGASGGTGASTVVSNLAYLASKKGLRVLVIDLNILFPIQQIFFTKGSNQLSKEDLISCISGRSILGDCIESNGNISIMYSHNRNLSDYIDAEGDTAVKNFTEVVNKLRQLYDLILIDAPIKIEHYLINTAFYLADSIYLVWDESISSITNTEKIRRNMANSGIDTYTKMKVILNKRTGIQYTEYPFKKLNVELVEILPFEQDIIYSQLKSEVFCEKGASRSKNADIYYNKMISLTEKVLKNGGYTK